MRIAQVEILRLGNLPVALPLVKEPVRESVTLVRITTDDGIIGISEISGSMQASSAHFIEHNLAPFLIGQNPLETERLMHQMRWRWNPRAHSGIWNYAVSAVDIALWDIKGKHFGEPVWRLLGGAQRSIPAYITFGLRTYADDELVEAAKAWVRQGQTGLKLMVGRLTIHGQVDQRGTTAEHREENPAHDEARVRAVREAVGPHIQLMVDANCLLTYSSALRWCQRLEPYDILWFEEPIVQNDARLLAELRRHTSIPIGAGQWDDFSKVCELVTTGAIDFLHPHVGSVGGYTMGMKAAAVAQSHNLHIGNGGVYDVHLHGAVPNGWRTEFHLVEWGVAQLLYQDPPGPVNGWVTLTDKPGLGLELREDALTEFRIG